MRDFMRNIQVVHLGNLVMSGTAVLKSDFVDMRGFDKSAIFVVNNTVADAGTAAGFTGVLVHSTSAADADADDCVAADTPDGELEVVVTLDTADDEISGGLGYIGGRRFVGVTLTGTTLSDADVTVIAVLSGAHVTPTALIGAAVART